ncbi:MAG TPA: hypothetical protein DEB10_00850 [Ruminococcaceae bacterium]|nr:hypothetical protein [Oscillospiraceae bacterium]HCA30391.1 hypothetical protein [Oscillospiraceae bacterium]
MMKMAKISLALLLSMTMMFSLAPAATAAESILKNPSLEDLNDDGTTTHWDVWPGNPSEGEKFASVSTTEKHSGKQSLLIELTPKNNQAVYQYHLLADQRFPFNKAYTFSFWVKMQNVVPSDNDGVRIGINRKGADGNSYDVREHIEVGTYGWTKVSLTVSKAMVSIVQYDVIVDIGRGTGKVYLDDFELVEAKDTTTAPVITTTRSTTKASEKTTQSVSSDTKAVTGDTTNDTQNPTETMLTGGEGTTDATTTTTTKANEIAGNTDEDGFNALPLVIAVAIIIAGGAVAVAVLIIRKKRNGTV